MRFGTANYLPRLHLRRVFDELGGRLDRYASYLYSLVLELGSSSVVGGSARRFVSRMCRDVSLAVLGYDVIPSGLPMSFDELVDHVFTAVMEWVNSNKEKVILKDKVVPKRESVEEYAKRKALEILSTCLERSLMAVGVIE